ncbi:META domain-containing protein [Hymenobacter sp. ASUV-10]|uniref:META domain-containing protein n=1 Tax=Hymenobacter aranciens TaxID=3063996 RepID=A0ABT9B9H7_9BACT|nr:META domain-containing protein [Hymenobacter sp. ASUV-10]MDO7874927.1 META domain-containing protein [Hymenobacter sp. ASUV-10]
MTIRPRLLLPLLSITALTLASCEKENASPSATALLDHRWLLTQVDGTALTPADASHNTSYLEFVDLGHCTVGLGPCNNFSSRFELGGGQQLHITEPITTRATCPAQELENRYLTNLARTARYEISGPELRLYDGAGSAARLVFRQEQK